MSETTPAAAATAQSNVVIETAKKLRRQLTVKRVLIYVGIAAVTVVAAGLVVNARQNASTEEDLDSNES